MRLRGPWAGAQCRFHCGAEAITRHGCCSVSWWYHHQYCLWRLDPTAAPSLSVSVDCMRSLLLCNTSSRSQISGGCPWLSEPGSHACRRVWGHVYLPLLASMVGGGLLLHQVGYSSDLSQGFWWCRVTMWWSVLFTPCFHVPSSACGRRYFFTP